MKLTCGLIQVTGFLLVNVLTADGNSKSSCKPPGPLITPLWGNRPFGMVPLPFDVIASVERVRDNVET